MTAPAPPTAPEAAPAPRWGLGDALVGWLVAETMALFAAVALLSSTGRIQPVGQVVLDQVGAVTGRELVATVTPLWMVAVLQAFLWFGLLGAPVLAARSKGRGLVSDFGLRMRAVDVPVGLAIGVACQLVLVPVVSIPWARALGRDISELEEPARALADKATDPLGVALLVLIVVIGAPVVEELFFRGLLQRSAVRRWSPAVAVALSSVVFGVTHFEVLQLPALIAFGLVLALLAQRTGRLGPSIMAHLAFNAVTVVALLVL